MKKKKKYNLECIASGLIAERGKKAPKKVKPYRKSKKDFLAELGIDYTPYKPLKKRKKTLAYKAPKISEKLKEAFVPLNKSYKIVQPIVVNPYQRKLHSITDRRWRCFSTIPNAVAKCGICGKIISSGYKSCDDYICSFCRHSRGGGYKDKKSKGDKCSYSVWTIRNR